MVWPQITVAKSSTPQTFGGDLGNQVSGYLGGLDIAASDTTNKPIINTNTYYKTGRLILYGATSTHTISFVTPTLSNDVSVTFPTNLDNLNPNTFLFSELNQTVTNKNIDAGLNNLFNIGDINIVANAGINWSKVSKTNSKLEDIADMNVTGRAGGSLIQWDATNSKWVMFSLNLDILLPNKTTNLPVASTTAVPIYRNDLDVNNQRGYVSKLENGIPVLVRLF